MICDTSYGDIALDDEVCMLPVMIHLVPRTDRCCVTQGVQRVQRHERSCGGRDRHGGQQDGQIAAQVPEEARGRRGVEGQVGRVGQGAGR